MPAEIIFIYNANSSIFSKAIDFAHKIISPKTYVCNLCAVTFGNFSMENKWKIYLEKINHKAQFFFKDDFEKSYPNNIIEFPTVLIKSSNSLQVLLNTKQLNQCKTLDDLIQLLESKLSDTK